MTASRSCCPSCSAPTPDAGQVCSGCELQRLRKLVRYLDGSLAVIGGLCVVLVFLVLELFLRSCTQLWFGWPSQ